MAAAEVVDHGGGALGAAVEADMRSGGAGAAQAGKGLGAHLVGRGGGRRRRTQDSRRQENLKNNEPTQGAIDRASRHIMQRIGCTIMCTNARIIDDEITMGAGLPGHMWCAHNCQCLLSENRAVHSTWERGECASLPDTAVVRRAGTAFTP